MRTIDADYSEQYLLPPSLEDWIGESHPARFIREVVEQMELDELGFKEQKLVEGRPPYANELLLRVWLYGYWKKIRSTRKLEEACRDDIGFLWLCGGHGPDHNTLWRFFRSNRKALRRVFRQTVRTALKLDLVGLVLQAVDGTKIQAQCSGWKRYGVEDLRRLEAAIGEQILELEAELEEAGPGGVSDTLPEALTKKQRLREEVRGALEEAREANREYIHPKELEARRMKSEGRNRFSYNAQAVVDESHQVIVAEDVVNQETDIQALVPMTEEARENTGQAVPTLADSGYSSAEQLQKAQRKGLKVFAAPMAIQNCEHVGTYHCSRFIYEPDTDMIRCPQNRSIPFERMRQRGGQMVRVYRSIQTCRGCPVRSDCTKDRRGRTIERWPGQDRLREMSRWAASPEGQELLGRRKAIVEPVFAQIKANMGFRRWTMRGLDNARVQWALLCSTWNLKVIYRQWSRNPRGPKRAGALSRVLNTSLAQLWRLSAPLRPPPPNPLPAR